MKAKKPPKKAFITPNTRELTANTKMHIDASFEDAMKALIKPKKIVKKPK